MTREELIEMLNILLDNVEIGCADITVIKHVSLDSFKFVLVQAIQALSQEPCDDAISRDELLKAIDTWDKFGVDDTNSLFRLDNLSLPHYVPYIHYDDVIKCIKGMPPVTQKSGNVYYK